MSSSPTLPNPADRATQRDEDAQYYRGILHGLVEMANDIARVVHRQATAAQSAAPTSGAAAQPQQPQPAPAPAAAPALAVAFDRLARTIRRTIALARKLSEPDRAPPGPKPHPTGRCTECCPSARQRRPDCAETDAPNAEPWAEPCERPEAPDCDADEDLDDDLDEQSLADLIASLRHDNGLATLTDAQLRQHRTPQDASESTQEGVPGEKCSLCARGARPTTTKPSTADQRLPTPPPRPGTGPPRH